MMWAILILLKGLFILYSGFRQTLGFACWYQMPPLPSDAGWEVPLREWPKRRVVIWSLKGGTWLWSFVNSGHQIRLSPVYIKALVHLTWTSYTRPWWQCSLPGFWGKAALCCQWREGFGGRSGKFHRHKLGRGNLGLRYCWLVLPTPVPGSCSQISGISLLTCSPWLIQQPGLLTRFCSRLLASLPTQPVPCAAVNS